MVVALSSLRVVAEIDTAAYETGMHAKVAADREGAASSAAVGAAISQTDVKLADSGGILGRLSRQYVDGFASAQRFDKAIRDLGRGIETGNVSMGQAQSIVDGVYKKFNLAADANGLLEKGQAALAAIVGTTNSKLTAQAEVIARAMAATQQLVAAQQAQAAINARLGVSGDFGGAARGEDVAAYGAELDRLRAKYSPMFAAQQSYVKALEDIRAANRVGAISQQEMAAAIEKTKLAFISQVNAIRGDVNTLSTPGAGLAGPAAIINRMGSMAGLGAQSTGAYQQSQALARANVLLATLGQRANAASGGVNSLANAGGLAAHQFTSLGYQLNDIITMLSMGASPFMILASQGGQVYQILSSSPQGVGGAVKEIGARMLALATPTNLLIAGIAGIGAAAVISYNQWLDGQRRVEQALSGRGRASGATVGDINSIAGTVAGNTGMSVASARELASQLAATGRIGVASLADIGSTAKDLAATLGTDIADATDILARSFADPLEGARLLGERLGTVDAATQRLIASLVAQSRTMEAQRLLYESTRTGLRDAAELTSVWGRAWTSVSANASNAWDWVGRAIDRGLGGGTIEQQIAFAQAEIARIQNGPKGRTDNGQAAVEYWIKRIAELTEKLRAAAAQADQVRANLQSLKDIGEINIVMPELDQKRMLDDRAEVLRQITGDPNRQRGAGITQEQADLAYGRGAAAVNALKTSQEMALAQAELATRAIYARSPTEKASIAYQQTYLALSRENLSEEEKRAQASLAAANASAQANLALTEAARERLAATQDQIGATQAEIDGIGRTAREAELLRLNWQAYADLRREAERNGLSFDQAQYDRLTRENAELARRNELLRERQLMNDLQFERDQMFRSPIEQSVASRLQSSGLPVDLNSAAAAQIRFNETLKQGRDLTLEFASSIRNDLQNGVSAIDALSNAFTRLADRLLDMAMNQAINGLFSNLMGFGFGGGGGGYIQGPVASIGGGSAGAIYANGGVFTGSNVVPFARGGIVNRPTLFPFAQGTGLMGEAGPEAIMPLRRDRAGRLGVAMVGMAGGGASAGAGPIIVNANVHPQAGQTADVTANRSASGGIDLKVVIRQIKADVADDIVRGRGAIGSAMSSRGVRPHTRG